MDFDFSKAATLDSLDSVPENFRCAYVEEGGKFVINPAIASLTVAITGLNTALKKERTTVGELRGRPDAAAVLQDIFGEALDVDAAKEKVAGFIQTIAEKGKVDPAKIRSEIEATFAAERTRLGNENAAMQSTLERYLVNNEALSALGKHKGNSKLLLPHITGSAKVVKDGDDYVVRVLDADGQYRGDGQGGFMGVEALVAEMKGVSDFAGAFESDTQGGGSHQRQQLPAAGQRTQQQVRTQQAAADMSPTDKISAGLAALHR